jgi:hypothetical protein
MIRNFIATRLAALVGIAASAAGLTAFDAAAQGTVTLTGASGNSCSYQSISIQPNGNLAVSCGSQGNGGVPVCTIQGSASASTGTPHPLTASCTNSPTSLSWTATNGVTPPGGASGSVIMSNPGTYSFTVQGSNANGAGPVSTAFVVTATTPAPIPPAGCTLVSSPVSPVAGEASTLTMSCANAPTWYAWAMYETNSGATLTIPSGTATGALPITYPAAGTYKFAAQAANAYGASGMLGLAVEVTAPGVPPPVNGCPTRPSTDVNPTAPKIYIADLRFDVRLGQTTGSAPFSLPLNGKTRVALATSAGTFSDTPTGSIAEVAIAPCPAQFDTVPAACKAEFSRGGWYFEIGEGTECNVSGSLYVNIRPKSCPSATGMCTWYVNAQ